MPRGRFSTDYYAAESLTQSASSVHTRSVALGDVCGVACGVAVGADEASRPARKFVLSLPLGGVAADVAGLARGTGSSNFSETLGLVPEIRKK